MYPLNFLRLRVSAGFPPYIGLDRQHYTPRPLGLGELAGFRSSGELYFVACIVYRVLCFNYLPHPDDTLRSLDIN